MFRSIANRRAPARAAFRPNHRQAGRSAERASSPPAHSRSSSSHRGPAKQRVLRLLRQTGRLIGRGAVVGGLAWGALVAVREGYAYATTSPRFEVRSLVYQPTEHVDDARVRELLGLRPGTNILALDLEGLAARIAADPWVARASVVREFPSTLIVEVEEHEATAVLLAGDLLLLDGSGKPFKRAAADECKDLPIVTGVTRAMLLKQPQKARVRVERALSTLRAYRAKQRPRVGEIHIGEGGEATLYTAERGTQLRLGRGNVQVELERYDALRVALGEMADDLETVHLDGSVTPVSHDRVVATFFPSADSGLLAQAGVTELPTAGQATASTQSRDSSPRYD